MLIQAMQVKDCHKHVGTGMLTLVLCLPFAVPEFGTTSQSLNCLFIYYINIPPSHQGSPLLSELRVSGGQGGKPHCQSRKRFWAEIEVWCFLTIYGSVLWSKWHPLEQCKGSKWWDKSENTLWPPLTQKYLDCVTWTSFEWIQHSQFGPEEQRRSTYGLGLYR